MLTFKKQCFFLFQAMVGCFGPSPLDPGEGLRSGKWMVKKRKAIPGILRPTLLMLILQMCTVEARSVNLPPDEDKALREITTQLGKKDWNFTVERFSINNTIWKRPGFAQNYEYNNSVLCDYTGLDEFCHVFHMYTFQACFCLVKLRFNTVYFGNDW
ncbi:uncharacterized protein LOC131175946 [Hevea brasiliensis]|uniref:uncharacterized protein LOC131175946 n=1 Tax=Hevea brasiliensis TaxID=3981 RepID=UPI0025FC82AA|nr:uncharacterized protein LOC131175946 [Hevea brasiliensis]